MKLKLFVVALGLFIVSSGTAYAGDERWTILGKMLQRLTTESKTPLNPVEVVTEKAVKSSLSRYKISQFHRMFPPTDRSEKWDRIGIVGLPWKEEQPGMSALLTNRQKSPRSDSEIGINFSVPDTMPKKTTGYDVVLEEAHQLLTKFYHEGEISYRELVKCRNQGELQLVEGKLAFLSETLNFSVPEGKIFSQKELMPPRGVVSIPPELEGVFGPAAGEKAIDAVMKFYPPQYEAHAESVHSALKTAYRMSMQKGSWQWNLQDDFYDTLSQMAELKSLEYNGEYFLDALTEETVEEEFWALANFLDALSIREYTIRHHFKFPAYGEDSLVDAFFYDILRSFLFDPANTAVNNYALQILTRSYLYSAEPRSLGEIVSEAEAFIQEQGRFPGQAKLSDQSAQAVQRWAKEGVIGLSAAEKREMDLSVLTTLVAKGLPLCPDEWNEIPPQLQARILALGEQMSGSL